jgi:hypothetical protein
MRLCNNPIGRKSTWITLGASMLTVAFLAGCPSISIDQLELDAETVTSESFTLLATVEVAEEDPAVDDDGNLGGGRGVLGVWLPPGWQVTGARLMGPQDPAMVEMAPLTEPDGHFPPPFPYVEGSWFAFVSDCANIEAGTFFYDAEIDIEGDGSQTAVTFGVTTALFSDEGSNAPTPTEVSVDLESATIDVREPLPAPAPAGLAECGSIPYEDPADEGGCGCAAPGVDRSGAHTSLIGVFAGAL